ncbi:MAG: hypothetical protein ACRDS0_04400 [Pseudonocardiaceae bacterium]
MTQADPSDSLPAAAPPRPSLAISALRPEPSAPPRDVHIAYWLWFATCLFGVITAATTLRYFGELHTMILSIVNRQFPQETPVTRDRAATATLATLIGAGVLISLIQFAFAVAMRSGRGWARFALVGLSVLGALYGTAVFGSAPSISRVGLLASIALMVISVVPMFLPGARTWFAQQRPVEPPG